MHRATTASRSVLMISHDYNPNPVIGARSRLLNAVFLRAAGWPETLMRK